jgi:hypothetical protein
MGKKAVGSKNAPATVFGRPQSYGGPVARDSLESEVTQVGTGGEAEEGKQRKDSTKAHLSCE